MREPIAVMQTTGNRRQEAITYGCLGNLLKYASEYVKAKEYHEIALAINIEMGDKEGEATCYGNLGTVFP